MPEETPVRITRLEVENVKKVRLVTLTLGPEGLTIIGGGNGAGKTSVLDAVVYALGGEKYRPSELRRDGSTAESHILITLSNGLTVERKGKNAALKVTDPSGKDSGQRLLDTFLTEFALNLPKFLEARPQDKAKALLQIIGIGDELAALAQEEGSLFAKRHALGQVADQKVKYATELPEYHDLPAEPMSAATIIAEQQAIIKRNGAREGAYHSSIRAHQAKNAAIDSHTKAKDAVAAARTALGVAILAEQDAEERVTETEAAVTKAIEEHKALGEAESTAELEAMLADIEAVNAKVRGNAEKAKAMAEARAQQQVYAGMTTEIETIRANRLALLEGADMPYSGLSVEDGVLTLNGKPWDCMSSSEQMRVGVAIVRKLNPKCGFVLLDGLERMDLTTLAEFGDWLIENGMQALATRVSTGDECSILIEEGVVKHA